MKINIFWSDGETDCSFPLLLHIAKPFSHNMRTHFNIHFPFNEYSTGPLSYVSQAMIRSITFLHDYPRGILQVGRWLNIDKAIANYA